MTEDETLAWHHQLNGHKFEQILGDVEGQRVCTSVHRVTNESDTTERLNNNPCDEKNVLCVCVCVNSRRSCSSPALVVGADLNYFDAEWFALKINRDLSVIFEIAPKYCISDSFVDFEDYSISSKGFLPMVINIMVI